MKKTVREEGIEQGIEQGRRSERLATIGSLIELRFQPVSAKLRQHLEQMPMDELWELLLKIPKAALFAELGLPNSNANK